MSSDSTLQTLPDEGGGGTLSQYYKNLRGWFTKDRATVITWNATIIIILITLVSIIAAFIYGTFYYVYIPQTSLVRQLYFQKSQVVKDRVDVDGSTMKVVVEGLHTEVVLGDLQHFLRPGQSYNVELELDMPDSDVNQMAGTFMVSALFYDNKNALLTSSSRLLMLKYRSWLLKILDTLFYAPLYLLDFL
ncbi:BSCL2 [Bugula neritina]|uniref:Seipin n=1 Tax=Bugula neritina TaxID=10212 RepID=A0A7J7J809_BUGNE|nr:BSCL2 [Bugula neritina]